MLFLLDGRGLSHKSGGTEGGHCGDAMAWSFSFLVLLVSHRGEGPRLGRH